MLITFKPFLQLQVLVSFLFSLTSVAAASSANLYSFLEPDSKVKSISAKRPRVQPSQGRVVPIVQSSLESGPIVSEYDQKAGFLVLGEFIHQTILKPFLVEYNLHPNLTISWDWVLDMNRDVRAALSRVNAKRERKISGKVFADAIRLYRFRHEIGHINNAELNQKDVATDYWRLVAPSLTFSVKNEIEGLLQENGLIDLDSDSKAADDDGWNLNGGLEKHKAAVSIATVELYEFIKKVIPEHERSSSQNQAVNFLGIFRNRKAHPKVSPTMARSYASALVNCTGYYRDIFNYILQ